MSCESSFRGLRYRAFLTHLDTLKKAITDPGHLATQLYAKGLITPLAHQRANLASLAPLERSEELLSALDGRIASDEGVFDKFLTVLSQDPVMEELCGKLRKSRDTPSLSSPTLVSSPSLLDLYASYLKDVYRQNRFPVYNRLQAVAGKKFINLLLLNKDDLIRQEVHEYTKAMFHGSFCKIASEKKMEMADIAKTEDGSIIKGKQRCILVEGAPGVGKTTFAWKLCRRWSKDKVLQQYRLVVLLRLREKRVRETKTASDLFRRCGTEAIDEICRSGGEGILLLLDGWDELPAETCGKDSFFLDLVQGQELPDATVLVTSRPHASEIIVTKCKDCIFQHIEIMGFTEDNVQAYMRSSTGDNAKLLQGLQTYTSCYPHITSMMYNPLNAAIVVEVYKNNWKEGSTIPKTLTELYFSLIRTLLLRYLGEHPVHYQFRRLRQFSDLPLDVYQQLCQVSRLAYEGISNKQQVIFSDLPDNFDSLDLMQCVPELYVDEGVTLSYNFLHLTMQEFLAAFHLSQQPTEEQVKIFECDVVNSYRYKMVVQFLAGLTQFKDISTDMLISILTDQIYRHVYRTISLDYLHLLFEAKESMRVLDTLSGIEFVHSSLYMSPFSCYVLSYIASQTSCKWIVDLNMMNFTPLMYYYIYKDQLAEMFRRGTMEGGAVCPAVTSTVSLCLHYVCLETSGLRQLLMAHPSFLTRITCLLLKWNGLDSRSCDVLSQSLPSMPHLQSLDLSQNAIGSAVQPTLSLPSSTEHPLARFWAFLNTIPTSSSPPECASVQACSPLNISTPPHASISAVQLIKSLQSFNTLTSMKLCNTRIGLPECVALGLWLSSPSCSLEKLDIGENNLPFEATELIVTSLCQECTLREFDVSGTEIRSHLLTPMLCLPLVKLRLRKCHIDSDGAYKIAGVLCTNTVLKELYLSHNPLGYKGAKALADMLLHNHNLKTLYLYDASLTMLGTQALLQSLDHNTTLSELWLDKSESLTAEREKQSKKCRVIWL